MGQDTLKQRIYSRILEEIVTKKYPVDCILKEKELSEKFGVSKAPVREARVFMVIRMNDNTASAMHEVVTPSLSSFPGGLRKTPLPMITGRKTPRMNVRTVSFAQDHIFVNLTTVGRKGT